MGTYHRAVHHAIFHIRVVGEVLQHPIPHAPVTPTTKTLIHTVPLPVFTRQQAPLRPAAAYPDHGFDEEAAFALFAHVYMRVISQKFPQLFPLFVS